jgi:hypothetical protein
MLTQSDILNARFREPIRNHTLGSTEMGRTHCSDHRRRITFMVSVSKGLDLDYRVVQHEIVSPLIQRLRGWMRPKEPPVMGPGAEMIPRSPGGKSGKDAATARQYPRERSTGAALLQGDRPRKEAGMPTGKRWKRLKRHDRRIRVREDRPYWLRRPSRRP